MTKCVKIISIVMVLFLVLFPVKSEASFPTFDKMVGDANSWLKKGESGGIVQEQKIVDIMLPIGQFLVGIGIFAVVIATIIMGIKYMSADPNTQGKLKQQMIGLVVSAVVIFGAYEIWRLVYNFMDGVTK